MAKRTRRGMSLSEIKAAVEAGEVVHWASDIYVVIKDSVGQWLIECVSNGNCTGLTWRDGVTMNGRESEFYIEEVR